MPKSIKVLLNTIVILSGILFLVSAGANLGMLLPSFAANAYDIAGVSFAIFYILNGILYRADLRWQFGAVEKL